MNNQQLPPLGSRLLAASGLFFLSPFIGEFLLGNMPVTYLWLLPVLGLMYGLGSIIIRETAIRLKLRWNGILLLCLVYGIIEEAILTQSLFDPNYLGLRLLDCCILLWIWSLRSGWTPKHGLSVVAGLTFTYIWFGFVQKPSVGNVSSAIDLAGNIVFSCVAVFLLFIAWRKLPVFAQHANNPN